MTKVGPQKGTVEYMVSFNGAVERGNELKAAHAERLKAQADFTNLDKSFDEIGPDSQTLANREVGQIEKTLMAYDENAVSSAASMTMEAGDKV